MSQKKELPKRLRHCVLICESLYNDYESTSPFAEVGNNPAIDYTLNWLNQQGLEEVFLFYSNLKTQVQQYHQRFEKSFDLKIKLNFMKAGELRSFGDVLRQVHFRNLVSEDFLVIYADTLVNLDLSLMIQTHYEKKVELKNVVLTTAMRVSNSPHLLLLNANTSQILQIQEGGKQFSLNTEKVNLKKVNAEFRRNLVSADIFICTIQILNSFKQTHQYTTMHDFIVGMLTSEVYQQKIIAYELKPQQIALRINKSYTTYLLYMNYICGYLFPYSPYSDDRLNKIQRNGTDKFLAVAKYHKIYRKGAKVSDSTQLSNNCYIGQNSKINQNCNVFKTIIGKNAVIGKNSVLRRCVVMDGVVLAQNSHFEDCLLQKVNQTLKIHSFKNDLEQQKIVLIQRQIFETTPQPEEVTFEEQLKLLLTDKPEEQTILVSELVRIRKQFQKSEAQLTREILKVLAPKGIKGVQSFTDQWGTILLKVHHDQQSQAIDSLYFSCTQIQDYIKAFHLFLQYFFHYQVFTKQAVTQWLKASLADNPNQTVKLCAPFWQKLQNESEQQQDQQDS